VEKNPAAVAPVEVRFCQIVLRTKAHDAPFRGISFVLRLDKGSVAIAASSASSSPGVMKAGS
jgi:hypothetical protein